MRNKPVVIKLTKDNYNDYNLLDMSGNIRCFWWRYGGSWSY